MTNNGSFNGPPRPWPFPFFSQVGWILGVLVTHSILAVFITFSNLVVLAAFYKNSKLRTTTNLIIISMATADLLVGCVVVPLWLYTADLQFMIGPPFQEWQIKLFRTYLYTDQALGLNSIFQLVLLHGLRSYSIAFPLKHRQLNNRKFGSFLVGWNCGYHFISVSKVPSLQYSCLIIISPRSHARVVLYTSLTLPNTTDFLQVVRFLQG